MTKKFMLKYFSPVKMAKMRNDVSSFVQMDLETLYDAWERYKDLLRRCPHHGLPLWLQVQTFYNAASGTLNNKTPEAAYEFIEEMTKPTKAASVFNLDAVTMLSNQVHPIMECDSNLGGVANPEYPPYRHGMENEQINYMGNNPRPQNNPYSNTYNAGWRNHPNFSWGGQGRLETQIGQLAKLIFERPQGGLLSNTKTNLREQLHAIDMIDEGGLVKDKSEPSQDVVVSKGKGVLSCNEPIIKEYKPRVPYPNAIRKDRTDEQFGKFLKLVKKLHINLPFLEALSQMPNSRKFLEELLTNKRRLDDTSHVELNAVCSAILQNKLPRKLKVPGSFTIPCLIGSLSVNNALADLGASINVMPYKLFKQLGLGKPKQTRMSIQLADKILGV
ncbi:reverse transcriptase [Gossypium australe]|uniref:Reverse transcriptase n=1 Tax=Gossypium australe TaxID=47621 RepID=A0A5B6X449_9ROSI|nr:reverse transcriptase [Gossypium australe]